MADDVFERDLITYDPLSETTRRERTALLGLSLLGVALVTVPLVPERFSALGVEFNHVNQVAFVRLYALVIVYYLAAFSVYAATDFIAWRRLEVIRHGEFNRRMRAHIGHRPPRTRRPGLLGEPGSPYSGAAAYWLAYWASRLRAAFEFLLPLGFGGYSLYLLLRYSPTQ